jgi:hypothetical protein
MKTLSIIILQIQFMYIKVSYSSRKFTYLKAKRLK